MSQLGGRRIGCILTETRELWLLQRKLPPGRFSTRSSRGYPRRPPWIAREARSTAPIAWEQDNLTIGTDDTVLPNTQEPRCVPLLGPARRRWEIAELAFWAWPAATPPLPF